MTWRSLCSCIWVYLCFGIKGIPDVTGTALVEESCAEHCGFHLFGLLQTFPLVSFAGSQVLSLGFKKIENQSDLGTELCCDMYRIAHRLLFSWVSLILIVLVCANLYHMKSNHMLNSFIMFCCKHFTQLWSKTPQSDHMWYYTKSYSIFYYSQDGGFAFPRMQLCERFWPIFLLYCLFPLWKQGGNPQYGHVN